MSSDDDLKIPREMREAMEALVIPLIVKRARMSGFFKPNELKSLYNNGQLAVETGLRNLGCILDRADPSDLDVTTANEAIKQIIHGALNLGAFWVVTKNRLDSSRGGKEGRNTTVGRANKWKKHVRTHVAFLHHKNPSMPGTSIRDLISKQERPHGIHLPNDRDLYEFILVELKALKQGIK